MVDLECSMIRESAVTALASEQVDDLQSQSTMMFRPPESPSGSVRRVFG
jgi:hypothetical protein